MRMLLIHSILLGAVMVQAGKFTQVGENAQRSLGAGCARWNGGMPNPTAHKRGPYAHL